MSEDEEVSVMEVREERREDRDWNAYMDRRGRNREGIVDLVLNVACDCVNFL